MLERYTLPPMRYLWSEEKKLEMWLKVELAFLEARADTGDLARDAYAAIKTHARADIVRVAELEDIFHHDFEAFVGAAQESIEKGGFGQYKHEFHKRLTSYSVEDPALILFLRYAVRLIVNELIQCADALRTQAQKHKWTLMMARTHGQDAKPSTFGHLLAVFVDEVERNIIRLEDLLDRELSCVSMAGAVGNYAGINPAWEKNALKAFGLVPANAETQILQRDRHAVVLNGLAVTASMLDQIAGTFWQMAHRGVEELREPFVAGQRGSTAMPHKRNPVKLEQIRGLARMVRAYAQVAMENIAVLEWHDISHSSAERHIFSGATSLVHYMVIKMTQIVRDLEVFEKRMWENLMASGGVWASQAVREALTEAGVDPNIAYRYVQDAAFRVPVENASFREILQNMPLSDSDARSTLAILGLERFNQCFDMRAAITPGIEYIFGNLFE